MIYVFRYPEPSEWVEAKSEEEARERLGQLYPERDRDEWELVDARTKTKKKRDRGI